MAPLLSRPPWKKEQLERQDAATRETHVWGRVGFRVSFSSFSYLFRSTTVDGGNPAPVDMEKTTIIYRVLYISGGAGFLPSTV